MVRPPILLGSPSLSAVLLAWCYSLWIALLVLASYTEALQLVPPLLVLSLRRQRLRSLRLLTKITNADS